MPHKLWGCIRILAFALAVHGSPRMHNNHTPSTAGVPDPYVWGFSVSWATHRNRMSARAPKWNKGFSVSMYERSGIFSFDNPSYPDLTMQRPPDAPVRRASYHASSPCRSGCASISSASLPPPSCPGRAARPNHSDKFTPRCLSGYLSIFLKTVFFKLSV